MEGPLETDGAGGGPLMSTAPYHTYHTYSTYHTQPDNTAAVWPAPPSSSSSLLLSNLHVSLSPSLSPSLSIFLLFFLSRVHSL